MSETLITAAIYIGMMWPVGLMHNFLMVRYGDAWKPDPSQIAFAAMIWPITLFVWLLNFICAVVYASFVWVNAKAMRR